jgi:hypothetical protein
VEHLEEPLGDAQGLRRKVWVATEKVNRQLAMVVRRTRGVRRSSEKQLQELDRRRHVPARAAVHKSPSARSISAPAADKQRASEQWRAKGRGRAVERRGLRTCRASAAPSSHRRREP